MTENLRYTSSGLEVVAIAPGAEEAAWQRIQTLCGGRLGRRGVDRLRDGVDGHVKSVLVEPQYVCRDYRDLYGRFYSKKFLERSSYCSRLHFFSDETVTVQGAVFDPGAQRDAYMGYSVIQPVSPGSVGRTVVDPFKIGMSQEGFWCLRTPFIAHINGAEYQVEAYPYFSQSAEAMVCAHAALWGVCRYLSARYPAYGEIHPYNLIEMTNPSLGRRAPYRGMTFSDYSEILSAFGCHPQIVMPGGQQQEDWTRDTEAFQDVYAYVESGFPVLASFRGHVVTLIGHTCRPGVADHKPDAGTRFFNSFALVKRFIAVDDNYFPYRLLGYRSDPDNYGKAFAKVLDPVPAIESLYAAVVPLPEKAFLTPGRARKLAYLYLKQIRSKIDEAVQGAGGDAGEPLIARLFLTSLVGFKDRKRLACFDRPGFPADVMAQFALDLNLPHFVWVMQVSPLTLHNQGWCVAEVVLDASANEYESQPVYIRVGRTLIRGGQEKVVSAGLWRFLQYTHNLGERDG